MWKSVQELNTPCRSKSLACCKDAGTQKNEKKDDEEKNNKKKNVTRHRKTGKGGQRGGGIRMLDAECGNSEICKCMRENVVATN